jgi:hypothetical protein
MPHDELMDAVDSRHMITQEMIDKWKREERAETI